MSSRQDILIIQTAFLGDLLLCIPLIQEIKKLYPEFTINIFARSPFGSFLQNLGLVDQVFELEQKNKKQWRKHLQPMLEKKYELVFCPHNSFRSFQILQNIDATLKVSFKRWFKFFSKHRLVEYDVRFPDALRQLALLASVDEGFQKQYCEYLQNYNFDFHLKLDSLTQRNFVPQWAKMNVAMKSDILDSKWAEIMHRLQIPSDAILLAPGSVWATKRWSKEHFLKISQKYSQFPIVLIGTKNEKEDCAWIKEHNSECIDISGKTSLYDLFIIMKKAKLLIGNDSGPMHLAAVAELPSVSVFGPTTLDIGYRPWQDHALVCQLDLDCRPCGKHGHDKCPIGTHECMKGLQPKVLEDAIEQFLTKDLS